METQDTSQLITDIANHLGLNATVSTRVDGDQTIYEIDTNQNSALIGYKGETLQALQYIINVIAKRKLGIMDFIRIDVGGYRKEQSAKIEVIAEQAIDKVKRTGQAEVMNPMNSAERRIVHLVCQRSPELECESVGVDPNRQIMIRLKREGEQQ